jgi:HlyD family secretion protein
VVHIRLLKESYADLIGPHKSKHPFRPGMSANVDIQTRTEKQVIAIPINAVTTRSPKDNEDVPGANTVNKKSFNEVIFQYLPATNTVKMLEVTTGIQDDEYIQVLSGISSDSLQVIAAPYTAVAKDLEDGKKVKVVPKKQLFGGDKK